MTTKAKETHLLSRRRALVTLSGAGALAIASVASRPLYAQTAPQENSDFTRLAAPQQVDHPGKIEVTEWFGFWCPHCNEFEPILENWVRKLPPDVEMNYVPIAFYDQQVPLQRLFYTLQVLGLDRTLRPKVFAAIHEAHTPLDTGEAQADWAAQNGIDKKKYLDVYNSFSVQSNARRASSMAQAYGISSVPTLSVDGKYEVLGSAKALTTLDYLIAQERRARK
jgi:protein dithiol oxidoreductase (disulfide-forming)